MQGNLHRPCFCALGTSALCNDIGSDFCACSSDVSVRSHSSSLGNLRRLPETCLIQCTTHWWLLQNNCVSPELRVLVPLLLLLSRTVKRSCVAAIAIDSTGRKDKGTIKSTPKGTYLGENTLKKSSVHENCPPQVSKAGALLDTHISN